MPDPLELLAADRTRARAEGDECADLCFAATVDAAGEPQARTVILRNLDERLAIFTNATSPKFGQFSLSRTLAILVYLPSVSVQYRMTCGLQGIDPAVVHESWLLRPQTPKRMDWVYAERSQSSVIGSREALLAAFDAVAEPDRAPETARGFYLDPTHVDRLDLTQTNGIHDRRAYHKRGDGQWLETVLVP